MTGKTYTIIGWWLRPAPILTTEASPNDDWCLRQWCMRPLPMMAEASGNDELGLRHRRLRHPPIKTDAFANNNRPPLVMTEGSANNGWGLRMASNTCANYGAIPVSMMVQQLRLWWCNTCANDGVIPAPMMVQYQRQWWCNTCAYDGVIPAPMMV